MKIGGGGPIVSPSSASFPGSPGNPLTSGVEAHYPFNETSGTRLDALSRGPGLAGQFTAANNEFLSRANDTTLQPGDLEITIAGWFYFDALGTTLGLASVSGASRGWRLDKTAADVILLQISTDGTSGGNVLFTTTLSVTTGVWYFIIAWHDPTLNTLNVQVNNGEVQSLAHSGGIFASTQAFEIGRCGASSTNDMDGRISCVGYWKSAVGLGGVLTGAQRTALYNGGLPRLYRTLEPGEKLGLIGYWELNEVSGTRADSHTNGFTLTDNATVTSNPGVGLSLSDVNTVTSTTGQVGVCAVFTLANSEQLVGGDILRSSDTDWSFHGLAYLAAKATDQVIFAKRTGAATTEYEFYYDTSSDVWRWTVYDGTNAIGTVDAVTLGAVSTATWYWIYVYHSATDNTVGIRAASVAGALGAADTAATTGAASSGTTAVFRMGANGTGSPLFLGGRLDAWTRHSRLLTSGEQTAAFAAAVAGTSYPWAS